MNSHFNKLNQGATIPQGSALICGKGAYYATLRDDGSLYVYVSNHFVQQNVVFSTHSSGKGHGPYRLSMQEDGNLVIYDRNNQATWSSDTYKKGQGPYRLEMQVDGNLVVYGGNHPVWASNTNR